MIVLDGQPALSPFRRERLNRRLAHHAPDTAISNAHYVYFVEPLADEAALDRDRLCEVLQAQATAPARADVWVVPRLGTISPWSSKASEILRGCALPVARVERGIAYKLSKLPALGSVEHAALMRELHDPMTQSVLLELANSSRLFLHGSAGALRRIELGDDARGALQAANAQLGLALSADEMEYLAACYRDLGRDPSDAELMMFAQANSEHCRHKVFNASWIIDGAAQSQSLFAMIRHTHAQTPAHTLSAYSDNAAVVAGTSGERFSADPASRLWHAQHEAIDYAIKCETHNHPTAIAPFPGASTGSGGEIRDEGATGRGAKPKAGLSGFSVSHLRIPGLPRPWEEPRELPPRMASALDIMLDGPIGAAAFNNEFGRPALCGYFRSFEFPGASPGLTRAYDKPIMLAGGLANIRRDHIGKRKLAPGDAVVVLGGPAMLIGLGGGAASSVVSGAQSAELDFASVQRDNPEMQRRCQEVIDRCWQRGAANPIVSIHDVGAGGLCNAIPEILHDAGVGGRIELRAIPCSDPALSPMQIWCNESQERYVLAIGRAALDEFEAICRRERCPYAVVGSATAAANLVVTDSLSGNEPIAMPMDVLFGKPPKMLRDTRHAPNRQAQALQLIDVDLAASLPRVLRHPSVGSKSFLISIGDRTVGGLCARDPMVGPYQTPLADCAVTLVDFQGYAGEAMAIGERTPLALLDAAASARMAVAEALTNLAAAPVTLGEVKLSANWMAAVHHAGEDAALFDAVRAVGLELCPQLGISIPVGKDSLSMQAQWQVDGREHRVVSPLSLIVTAFARVDDARRALTPELCLDRGASRLLLIDLGAGKNRLGGSILGQVLGQLGDVAPDLDAADRLVRFFGFVQKAARRDLLLAYHDRSDGGALTCVAEMAFAARCGLRIVLDGWAADPMKALFNEELGAVMQVRDADLPALHELLAEFDMTALAHEIGSPVLATQAAQQGPVATVTVPAVTLIQTGQTLAEWPLAQLLGAWHETSHALQRLRDDPDCADEERQLIVEGAGGRLVPKLSFDPAIDIAAPYIARGARPKVAILREQGVNGQVEMAAAFTRAGFDAYDVHMSDLIGASDRLANYSGLVACGGFSYGDVLGAGRGWATSIRYHADLAEQFRGFFADPTKFALGVCNGCQMFAAIKDLVPGAEHWPRFVRNRSEQFEARLALVEVMPSASILLRDMAGSRIPVAVAHGEGRAEFSAGAVGEADVCLRYVDADGNPASRYPLNPNGSPLGITGLSAADGRVTILMPHPERVFRSVQMSWRPREWGEDSPWMRMFRNARTWVG